MWTCRPEGGSEQAGVFSTLVRYHSHCVYIEAVFATDDDSSCSSSSMHPVQLLHIETRQGDPLRVTMRSQVQMAGLQGMRQHSTFIWLKHRCRLPSQAFGRNEPQTLLAQEHEAPCMNCMVTLWSRVPDHGYSSQRRPDRLPFAVCADASAGLSVHGHGCWRCACSVQLEGRVSTPLAVAPTPRGLPQPSRIPVHHEAEQQGLCPVRGASDRRRRLARPGVSALEDMVTHLPFTWLCVSSCKWILMTGLAIHLVFDAVAQAASGRQRWRHRQHVPRQGDRRVPRTHPGHAADCRRRLQQADPGLLRCAV